MLIIITIISYACWCSPVAAFACCFCIQHHTQLSDSAIVTRDADSKSKWLHLFQVNAAVGCLARMPLPHAAFKPPVQHSTSQPPRGQRQQNRDRPASRFGSELWAPYLRDTALRVFGSVGVAGQLGHFCRPVLDFTAGTPLCPGRSACAFTHHESNVERQAVAG